MDGILTWRKIELPPKINSPHRGSTRKLNNYKSRGVSFYATEIDESIVTQGYVNLGRVKYVRDSGLRKILKSLQKYFEISK